MCCCPPDVFNVGMPAALWLLQVAPKGPGDKVLPFAMLLGGLFVPDMVAATVACWTWVSHERPLSDTRRRLLLTTGWLLPFTAWLHVNLIKDVLLSKGTETYRSCSGAQPAGEGTAAGLSRVVDPIKYMALRSAAMAVTEDPVSMGVTSAFYLLNKQQLGQVLSTPAYCISMTLSCMHLLMEAWEHFPRMRQGLGGCVAGLCSLQPPAGGLKEGLELAVLPVVERSTASFV
jgi:hypothetical protein